MQAGGLVPGGAWGPVITPPSTCSCGLGGRVCLTQVWVLLPVQARHEAGAGRLQGGADMGARGELLRGPGKTSAGAAPPPALEQCPGIPSAS